MVPAIPPDCSQSPVACAIYLAICLALIIGATVWFSYELWKRRSAIKKEGVRHWVARVAKETWDDFRYDG